MAQGKPPVIVIGMHRSGTTLLTRALQQAGLYMGPGPARNEEARFTNDINAWIFRQASATWDRPESLDLLLEDDQVRPWLVDYMGGITDGPAAMRFLGPRRWARYRGLSHFAEPWGWKDPRNTYTLPLWLQLFPDARIIHIVRHGVDVAASLRHRRQRTVDDAIARYRRREGLYCSNPFAPKRRGFGGQVRCRTLEGGFDLWSSYIERAREHVAAHGERAIEVVYEGFLDDPEGELERVMRFCELTPASGEIRALVESVDPGRAYAHRRDPELAAFAAEVTDRLVMHGYDSGP